MDERPKRRWLRFRLSTVLILTAILAWGMACRPYIVHRQYKGDAPDIPWVVRYAVSKTPNLPPPEVYWLTVTLPNADLRWPALTLAAFIGWKTAWVLGPQLVRCVKAAAAALCSPRFWKRMCLGGMATAIIAIGLTVNRFGGAYAESTAILLDAIYYLSMIASLSGATGWFLLCVRERRHARA
jgi:hypothetical protein